MIERVEHLHPDVGHGVWLLSDRGSDSALLYPVECLRVCIHRHDNFAFHVVAVEQSGDLFTRLRLKADKGVNFVFFFADDLGSGVESNTRIALNIHDAGDLDVGRAIECVFVSALTLLQIGLAGHGENNHVAFALQFLGKALSSREAGLVVVGADEKEPLAGGCVRVDRDYRDARGHSLIDAVFEQSGIGNGQEDARGFLLHRLIQSVALSLGVVRLWTHEANANLRRLSRLAKTSPGSLPIRDMQIGRYEKVIFVGVVRRATTEKSYQQNGNATTVEKLT